MDIMMFRAAVAIAVLLFLSAQNANQLKPGRAPDAAPGGAISMAPISSIGGNQHSLFGEPTESPVARWFEPRVMELRSGGETLWSQELPAGLWKAAITHDGQFLGCFWKAAPIGQRMIVQVLGVDGLVRREIELAMTPIHNPSNDPDPYLFAVTADAGEIWACENSISPATNALHMVRYQVAQPAAAPVLLRAPEEISRYALGNIFAVPGIPVVGVSWTQRIMPGDRDPLGEHDAFISFFSVDDGAFIATVPALRGAPPEVSRAFIRELDQAWGMPSGVAWVSEGRLPGEANKITVVRFTEHDHAASYRHSTVTVASEEELAEHGELVVARMARE